MDSFIPTPFFTRLADRVRHVGSALCAGIDPRHDMLPMEIQKRHNGCMNWHDRAKAYLEFGLQFISLIASHVAVVKFQSAFFEAVGPDGLRTLRDLIDEAHCRDLLVILDVKRGDISTTAEAYADAAFNYYCADAVTVNPYMGSDAVLPFVEKGREHGAGVFVLCLTSNPGHGLIQRYEFSGRQVYQNVGSFVSHSWSKPLSDGMRDVGLVLGATNPFELGNLRVELPNTWFLIPGYGAQGATAADCKHGFCNNGIGAIVNSSRGVMFPFKSDDPHWQDKIVIATKKAASDFPVTSTEVAHV